MSSVSRLPKFFWSGLLLITAALIIVIIYRLSQPKTKSLLPIYGQVIDFQLTNQLNQVITRESLLGKVWVANFIFTSCPGPCPMMSQHVAKIQQSLRPEDNIKLISITVDPQTDTPAVLKKYGEHFQADSHKWFFLTGNQNEIFRLATKGFLLAVVEAQEAEVSRQNGRYIHSTKLALVDREGNVRAYYEGTDPNTITKLLQTARALNQ